LSKKLQLGIVEKKSNTLIGMVVAYNFNYFNRTCSVSSIIDYRKRLNNKIRLFKESQDLIIEHVFFKMNFRKICTGTSSEKLSLLSEKLWGFKREGTLKKHAFINGEYVDNFILGLFREDWKIFKKKLN